MSEHADNGFTPLSDSGANDGSVVSIDEGSGREQYLSLI